MQQEIKGFFGKYRNLSNFGEGICYWRGYKFPCRENAFQFAKGLLGGEDPASPLMMRFYQPYSTYTKDSYGTVDPIYTPKEAKKAGKKVQMHPEWDKMKRLVMFDIVLDCFRRNPELADLLLGTEDAYLEESNYWHDIYWGKCHGFFLNHKCHLAPHDPEGENTLGQILMEVRKILREERERLVTSYVR